MLKIKTLVKRVFILYLFIYYKLNYYFKKLSLDILELLQGEWELCHKLPDSIMATLVCHVKTIEEILLLESISEFTGNIENIRTSLLWAKLWDVMIETIIWRINTLWVLLHWERLGFNTGWDIEFSDIDVQQYRDIYNICLDWTLATLFHIWKSIWVLGSIETAEEENELKLLNTSYEECQAALIDWKNRDNNFEFTENRACDIVDELYDDINLRLDRQVLSVWWKRSCRIRKKIYSPEDIEYLYTLKRKHKKEKDESWKKNHKRKSDEKESPILKPEVFYEMISWIGFKKTRTKRKHRRSFNISYFDVDLHRKVQAQIDIDKYEHDEIPEFIEIECHDDEAIKNIIKNLWFEGKTVFTKGSRGLYREYNVYEDYEREYTADDTTWIVNWNDGSIWDMKHNGPLEVLK